ncbi:hypothetical protein STAFG_8244 [Streptomyces afghaniensis 772]|uniref:Uncharacterized protein n=1 Tax=Streptomyces afghaniensis 772 TaxID=1283301 RepID=S4NA34_9ACTN|nr:hypothetical protein STAFG_8244 [Streptomyces afghaniensis 772]
MSCRRLAVLGIGPPGRVRLGVRMPGGVATGRTRHA